MTVDPYDNTDRLAKLIALKHDVLAHLHALAQRQLAVIAADEVDRLMSLLAEKQKLLHQLERIERTLDPFRQQDADARLWRTPQQRRQCQVIADRANILLAELMQLEKQAEAGLIASRDTTAHELQAASSALAARQAYVAAPAAPSQGLDLVSES